MVLSFGCSTASASTGNALPSPVTHTKDGYKPIEEIEVGDEVYSENPETGEKGLKKVVQTFIREKDTLVILEVADTRIETTEEHPFWVVGEGWVEAGDLQTGDALLLQSGSQAKIKEVELLHLAEPVKVHNFEVEDFHTYYVSDVQVLVHNAPCGAGGNTAYVSKAADGTTQYVGITKNIARRKAEHSHTKGIDIEPLLTGLSRSDARAVEQTLIEFHGLSKNGGTLINKINSIAKSNPKYAAAIARGFILLKNKM